MQRRGSSPWTTLWASIHRAMVQSSQDKGQTRSCDDNWDSWPRAYYERFPRQKTQRLQKRANPITVWPTEVHAGVQRELRALESLLHVPIKLEYRDLWQIIEVARSCDAQGGCVLPQPGMGLNITKLYYKAVGHSVDLWGSCPRPRELRRQVFETFTKNPALAWSDLATADLLYFSAPFVPFELFLPFDLPMIVQAPDGFELGRDLPHPGGEYHQDTVKFIRSSTTALGATLSPWLSAREITGPCGNTCVR